MGLACVPGASVRITQHRGLECETKKSVSLRCQEGGCFAAPGSAGALQFPLAPKDCCSFAQAKDDGVVIADAHGVPVWFREARSGVGGMAHSRWNACLVYRKP